jgi:hypothetical protein
VHDAVVDALSHWHRTLQSQGRVAIRAGELSPEADPEAIAFQLNALAMAANQAIQLFGDRPAAQMARRAMHAALNPRSGPARLPVTSLG